ncbi:MAG TPA: cytochrome P450 [Hymenobacter sp.]|jgi:fatty-acid peroxygenase
MPKIPQAPGFDSTLAVLREGFPFIWNRCQQLESDIFQTRFMLQKAICLHGPEAAALFYDASRFMRTGAVPRRIQTTLMGKDAIHTLDDGPHQRRKCLFMDQMTAPNVTLLLDILAEEWEAAAREWERMDEVVLFPAAQDVLCRAICAWVGVPLRRDEVRKRARDFGRMIDAFGGVGPRHQRGKRARDRAEAWVRGFVKDVRKGRAEVEPGSPAEAFIWFEDEDGELLSAQMAAEEIINLLRPTVAISFYIAFAAKALAEYPRYRQLLQQDDNYAHLFAQEVRRATPFAPFLGARVQKKFTWKGYEFPKGTLTLIDIYGTNHDPRVWQEPDTFWPERFENREPTPFDMLPQGGGDYRSGHRCPGEWITLSVLKQAVNFLARCLRYQVPPQDLSFDLTRMPTLPRSGFIMQNVRLLAPQREAPVAAAVAGCPFHRK